MQAALDLADQGFKVYLVERYPSIGGIMAKLDKTFPTLDCASCLITPRLVEVGGHPNIDLHTYSEVVKVQGQVGKFHVTISTKPRYVDVEKCTGCGECIEACVLYDKVRDDFNEGVGKRGACYIPFPQAVPLKATIDPEHCQFLTQGKCAQKCIKVCGPGAIDFKQKPKNFVVKAGAIIVATGYRLDDPAKKSEFGYGVYPDVITSLQLERMLSPSGPTGGHVRCPSDGRKPRRVGFVQCVCSRDINTNLYCSRFCCMYGIKEGILIKELEPDTEVSVFYIDVRAFGKGYEEFYRRAREEFGIKFVKGRISEVRTRDGHIVVLSEDVVNGGLSETELDLVVLAVGAIPPSGGIGDVIGLPHHRDGFFKAKNPYEDAVTTEIDGVFLAGSAEGPKDIPDTVVQASAAAMKASIILGGVERNE